MQTLFDFTVPSNYTLNNAAISGAIATLLRNLPSSTKTKTSDFGTPGDYTFNAGKISLAGGLAGLVLTSNPSQSFSQNYAAGTGFTFNASNTEFASSVMRQKDNRGALTFYADYTSSINANVGGGSLTGTSVGGAAVSGGKLDLTGVTNKYVTYVGAGNAAFTQTGCIRVKVTPGYSGTPGTSKSFITLETGVGTNANLVAIAHLQGSGQINILVFNSSSTSIINVNLGIWVPVSGTTYEFELNVDITTGATRLFIDGTQFGTTQAATGTRTAADIIIAGSSGDEARTSDFKLDELTIYSAVQHTTTYSAPTAAITIYNADSISLPLFTYPGPGSLQAFTGATVTDTNAPGYTANGKYWNGSAWVTSNGTFAQSSTAAQIVANLATLPASNTLQIVVITVTSNTQMSTSLFTANYTGQLYDQTNPTIDLTVQAINDTLPLNSIDSVADTEVVSGSDAIQYAVSTDQGVSFQYWNGSAWAASTNYATSNPLATLNAHLATLNLVSQKFLVRIYIHSANGTTTPTVDNVIVSYRELLYRTDGGSITSNSGFTAQTITAFISSFTATGLDSVKFAFIVNSTRMYWTGSAWASSDGTIAQTNTLATIQANMGTLLAVNSTVKVYMLLISGDGTTTPSATSMTATYNFGDIEGAGPATCDVFGFLRDMNGNTVSGAVITFTLVPLIKNGYVEATSHVIIPGACTATTDSNGYFEKTLVRSSAYEGTNFEYHVSIVKGTVTESAADANKTPLKIVVPDAASADLTALLTA